MARPYSNDLRERVASGRSCREVASLFAIEQLRPKIARRREQWKKYQGRLDPRRLVFIDETWNKTKIDLAPENWSALKERVSAILRLKGAENGTEELHSRADHWDASGGRGAAFRRREDGVICRGLGISEQSYYRWRREYGGLKVTQAARLKSLEKENTRLRKVVSNLTLDAQILKEVIAGK